MLSLKPGPGRSYALHMLTNRAGNVEEDFEKSEEYGSRDTLHFVEVTAKTWLSANARKT